MKKFRYELLAEFISNNYSSCKVLDIGGGKGLLTYILNSKGFHSIVIDPVITQKPTKYRQLDGKRIKIKEDVHVEIIKKEFEIEDAKDFDLLVSLHGHGCNLRIIDAAFKYNTKFIILPCCIINEGIDPYSVTDWIEYLENYAISKGMSIRREKLNFKGQRTLIYN